MTRTSLPTKLPLGRDSVSYRINLEPVTLLVGGPRALLLQVTHDVVARGVADHSDYEKDPWSRLIRTIVTMSKLAHGSPEQSAHMTRYLKKAHATINGELDGGERYRALDPENMLWVWATLLDTLIEVYDNFVRRLSRAERMVMYEEWLLVAEGCGIPRASCPPTYDHFVDYVAATVDNELDVTDTARSVERLLRQPPLPGVLGDLVGGLLGFLVPAVLPPSLRERFGHEWTAANRRLFRRVTAGSRLFATLTPGPLRRLPMALVVAGILAIPDGGRASSRPARPVAAAAR